MTRVLGVDFGSKRLGFALGDAATKVAVPLHVVELRGQDPVMIVAAMVKQDGYDQIVVGTARTMDGEATAMSSRAEAFAKALEAATHVPVALVNEYLTSKASDTLAQESGRGVHDDALAAMLIVQEFLNLQPSLRGA